MNEIQRLLRSDLRGRKPYGAPQLDVPVRLNTNENSYPMPDAVAADLEKAVASVIRGLNRYPDRDAIDLRTALASYLGHGLSAERVWAANGSNEILQQLLQAFGGPGRTALGFTPDYSMYPIISAATGTAWRDGGRDAEFALSPAAVAGQIRAVRPDVVFLCSPNNPTGTAVDSRVPSAAVAAAEGIVVVDEAYAEFARAGTRSALELLPDNRRMVVTRTMSKAFALAGARVGYLAADPEIVAALQLVRLPYHLSALTQAVAIAAVAHAERMLATVDAIKAERDRIVTELTAMGLRVAPSDTNFVLFGGLTDSSATWRSLVDEGVLVRDVGLPGWLRVTAGTPAETDAFLSALRTVLENQRR